MEQDRTSQLCLCYIYIYFCLSFTADLTFKVFLNLVTSDSSSSAARDNLLKCCVLPTDLSEPVSLSPRSSSQLIDSNRKGRIAHLQLKGCSSSLGRKAQCCLKLKTTRTHPPPHTYSETCLWACTNRSFFQGKPVALCVCVPSPLCCLPLTNVCVSLTPGLALPRQMSVSSLPSRERNNNFALHVCVCVWLVGLLTSLVFGNEDFFTKTLDWDQSHKREWLFPSLGAEFVPVCSFSTFLWFG